MEVVSVHDRDIIIKNPVTVKIHNVLDNFNRDLYVAFSDADNVLENSFVDCASVYAFYGVRRTTGS